MIQFGYDNYEQTEVGMRARWFTIFRHARQVKGEKIERLVERLSSSEVTGLCSHSEM